MYVQQSFLRKFSIISQKVPGTEKCALNLLKYRSENLERNLRLRQTENSTFDLATNNRTVASGCEQSQQLFVEEMTEPAQL